MAKQTASPQKQPNVVVIMGDDIGWFNIGAYHQGMMAGRTPHIDRMAAEGVRFTDYYAVASCTAGTVQQADFFKYEFWRFVFVQQEVGRFAQTFVDFPPLQKPASFNLDAIKEKVMSATQAHHSA